jgi:hypothetical protein
MVSNNKHRKTVTVTAHNVDEALLDVQKDIFSKLIFDAYDHGLIGLVERDQLLGLDDMLQDLHYLPG